VETRSGGVDRGVKRRLQLAELRLLTPPLTPKSKHGHPAIVGMASTPFGSNVPYAEPFWNRGLPSPYYDESHAAVRSFLRKWTDDNLVSEAFDW
jgi:hypothetical protein